MDLISKKMKKYLFLLLSVIFLGCTSNSFDAKLKDYIITYCDFSNKDTCRIDLKNIFKVDYDTMYLFDGYSSPESIPLIIEGKSTKLTGKFIYGTEKDMIVLSRNKKIVHKTGWKHQFVSISYDRFVEKKGLFDGDSIVVSACIYVSSVFLVREVVDDKNKLTTYVLEPIK